MSAVRMWAGLELRRRWRSLTVLALLIALASGTIMATLAGARRGDSAQSRLAEKADAATIVVLPNQPGFNWDQVRNLPEVESLTGFFVTYNLQVDGVSGQSVGFPWADDNVMRTIEKPVIQSGRVFNPTRPDEVVVSPQFAKSRHLGVGDHLTIHLATAKEVFAESAGSQAAPPLHGPVVRATIVGVVTSPWFSDLNAGGPDGGVTLSPGLVRTYPASFYGVNRDTGDTADQNQPGYINALIRLKGGTAAIPAFEASFKQATGRDDIDIWNRAEQTAEQQRHFTFLAQCLVAFAAAVFIAALVLVGQAIARFAAANAPELTTMRAIGMSPRQAIASSAWGPVVAGAIGVVIGAAGAFAASSLFPFGSTKYVEPHLGRSFDPLVLIGVPILLVLLVLAGASFSAWTALGAAQRRSQRPRRSTVATAAARVGLPIPVLLGTRFAFEPGRGKSSVPVRPALIGAVAGVLGIVGAFTVAHGVQDAGDHPERFGQTYQLGVFAGVGGHEFIPAAKVTQVTAQQPEVAGVLDSRIAVATGPKAVTTTLLEYSAGPKPVPVVLSSGRMPSAPDEVVLAPTAMRHLDTAVGQRVQFTGADQRTRSLLVTGEGFVASSPHNDYDDGGWVTSPGFDSLFPPSAGEQAFKFKIILVTLKHGLDPATTAKTLAARANTAIPELGGQANYDAIDPPTQQLLVAEVQKLPIALGFFLVLLALAAVGHALATAVRRRSGDIAVLRALGLTRRQSRWIVVTQATLLAMVGLVFGIPLGLALGRLLWQAIASFTPVQYVAPLALSAILLVIPLAILAANALAAWPGWQLSRLRVALVLRAE